MDISSNWWIAGGLVVGSSWTIEVVDILEVVEFVRYKPILALVLSEGAMPGLAAKVSPDEMAYDGPFRGPTAWC